MYSWMYKLNHFIFDYRFNIASMDFYLRIYTLKEANTSRSFLHKISNKISIFCFEE